MKRREFLARSGLAAGSMLSLPSCGGTAIGRGRVRWRMRAGTGLFAEVVCDGEKLAFSSRAAGVLGARLRRRGVGVEEGVLLGVRRREARLGALRVELSHRLRGETGADDLMEGTVAIRNEGGRPEEVEACFLTGLQPGADTGRQRIYIPLSAAGGSRDGRFAALGVDEFLEDCTQRVGSGEFACHYLEPMASFREERTTRALLLAPVVDIFYPSLSWRVALFTPSDQPARFRFISDPATGPAWETGRTLTVAPGETVTLRCWLHLHLGDAASAWRIFQRFGHREDHPPVDWAQAFRVHYYDFLSSAQGKDGRRGDGYEADLGCFRDFRVGLATQHGYYPNLGDYIRPDRKTWEAMRGDKRGAAEMSFEKMRERIRATREAGARAAIYLHPALFDDAAPNFEEMRDCVMVDEGGSPVPFPWQGPDTQGKNWRASLASPRWREHLLRQAQWTMEILAPDAIVVDETFAGLGYDHHPDRAGPMSPGAMDFYRKLRTLVRSFGADRAVFSSDCSLAPFVYWFDGECGDHAYPNLLGRESYTQEPVRFLAALGEKPWRPCAWHFQATWDAQMKLARQVGAGVGVSNGWIEFTGLAGLPLDARERIIADIGTLV